MAKPMMKTKTTMVDNELTLLIPANSFPVGYKMIDIKVDAIGFDDGASDIWLYMLHSNSTDKQPKRLGYLKMTKDAISRSYSVRTPRIPPGNDLFARMEDGSAHIRCSIGAYVNNKY